ncbi:MAG: Tex family protein [Myxococcales bacterium]|nr:RNA-binding transcriptional accessory protein [Myxococcota bacterium]MDW8280261.1 Tex family protein [Myxococcales bacterium]
MAKELGLDRLQVARTLELLDGGATLPFIARYRKEMTGGLDEVQVGMIRDRGAYLAELVARKETVVAEIHRQGKLTPELLARIRATLSKTELEDLYLPYKPKRRTRATIARERGLEPLAQLILQQDSTAPPREELAAPYINEEKGLPDVESVFAGARDIVAEIIAESADVRAALRALAMDIGVIRSRLIPRPQEDDTPEPGNEKEPGRHPPSQHRKKEDPAAKFSDYFNYEEPVRTIPSHRILALRRGEREGVLRVTLEIDGEQALEVIRRHVVRAPQAALASELARAMSDSWERLLKPAIEVDVRLALRERADAEAIQVFAENLRNLLLQPMLGSRRVLALDPGYRTGCKVAVLDEKGDLLAHDVIYPTHGEARRQEAMERLERLCSEHKVEAIAIGNGTASRETESFVRRMAAQGRLPGIKIAVVNEAGASVYSASAIGREELPDQDITVRGAVSIGRRLQDPLAELVKIEARSIGVGQYQHDVHQPTLKKKLDQVVESCVNSVGVDLNTASRSLLQYVSGLSETLAANIVAFRSQHGPFRSRQELLQVPRLGPKAFEQAAGFLRIRQGALHPLDASAVHPESYDVVERMAKDLGVDVATLIGNAELVDRIDLSRYIDERRGEPTLRDILAELKKPGRDPRAEFEEVGFNPNVTEFEHVQEGMLLNGVVTNVTNFGAFVDIGVHQDGLVHVSELSHRFVKDPAEVVKVGDKVKVKVVKVDRERRRIGLSIKAAAPPPPTQGEVPRRAEAPRPPAEERAAPVRPEGNRSSAQGTRRQNGGAPSSPRSDSREAGGRDKGRARPAGPTPSKPFSTPFNQIRIRTSSKN